MFTRRACVAMLGGSGLMMVIGREGLANQLSSLPRVGLLWVRSKENSQSFDLMVEGLRTRGHVAGKNIEFDTRFLVDRYDDLQIMAGKLALERPALILCFGATATRAMADATSTVPIVTVSGLDPVKAGYAVSLARPGRNLTGFVTEIEPTSVKRLEVFKEAIPGLRRVGVLYAPQSQYQSSQLEMIRLVSAKLKLHIEAIEIRAPEDIKSISRRAKSANIEGLYFGASTLFRAHRQQLLREIEVLRLPAIFPSSDYVMAGGLLSYGANHAERFRKGVAFVERVLKGVKPGDIPIEQETIYDLTLNLKTAKTLGITIPQTILVRATRVIE